MRRINRMKKEFQEKRQDRFTDIVDELNNVITDQDHYILELNEEIEKLNKTIKKIKKKGVDKETQTD